MPAEIASNQSAIIQLLSAFGFGFLSSFTPCVFPLIPITLALFGIKENTSRLQGFLLAASYVGGIALTYTTLGMISAKTGMVFGSFLGNPWVVLALDCFLIAMALFSLEALQLSFFGKIQTSASKIGGQGFGGAFLMGAASGFVAAPCVGPALIVILGLAASSQSVIWGAALLFSYSLGLGVIFLFLGTFSQLTQKLPKSGNWLNAAKFTIAVALFMVVIFLSQRFLLPIRKAVSIENSLMLLLFMENLSFFMAWYAYKNSKTYLRVAAAILLSFSLFQFVFAETIVTSGSQENAKLEWSTTIEDAINKGKEKSQIVMVDLFADWCGGCKELDSKTFSNPNVKLALANLSLGRVDFTDTTTPVAVKITERYGVAGLPCVLFLKADGSGDEVPDSRITGYVPADEFLKHLEKLEAAVNK